MNQNSDAPRTVTQRFLDMVEKVGNLVPHPVLIFLILIAFVIVLSHVLYWTGVAVTFEAIVPKDSQTGETYSYSQAYDTGTTVEYDLFDEKSYSLEEQTVSAKSLLTADGIRFMYVSLIPSFMSFTAVGLMIVAMVGAGVAEESGLVNALIRKLVILSPLRKAVPARGISTR